MRFLSQVLSVLVVVALAISNLAGQTAQPASANDPSQPQSAATPTNITPVATNAPSSTDASKTVTTPDAGTDGTSPKTVAEQVKDARANVKAIQDALSADSDLDFSLVVGIASLIVVSGSTDYSDQSNVIHSNNVGKATPQFLTGVAFRSHLPNIVPKYRGCPWDPKATTKATNDSSPATDDTTPEKCKGFEPWQKRPWNAFVSVKFAPGASQTLNGFVFGASYALTKYLNALVGFSLTPINEPAPGFRTTAAQFVTAQQKQGQYLNFNPTAMLNNTPNAFDGFPVTDPTGKLLYTGNPLTVHYHGGAVFGVSIPIYFSSVFK